MMGIILRSRTLGAIHLLDKQYRSYAGIQPATQAIQQQHGPFGPYSQRYRVYSYRTAVPRLRYILERSNTPPRQAILQLRGHTTSDAGDTAATRGNTRH